jgi:hypothetical protein
MDHIASSQFKGNPLGFCMNSAQLHVSSEESDSSGQRRQILLFRVRGNRFTARLERSQSSLRDP